LKINRIGAVGIVLSCLICSQAFAAGTIPASVISKGVSGSVSFTDLDKSNPYYSDISQLVASGLWNKLADGTILPDRPVNRIDAVNYFAKVLGTVATESDELTGLNPEQSKIVGGLLKDGVIVPSDYSTGFMTNGFVSRHEVLVWAARALDIYNESWAAEKIKFDDYMKQHRDGELLASTDFFKYSQDADYVYLYLAVKAGFTTDKDLRVADSITRGELAHVIVTLDEKLRLKYAGISNVIPKKGLYPDSYTREFTSGLSPLSQGEITNEVRILSETTVTTGKDQTQVLAKAYANVEAKYQNKTQYLRTNYERVKLAVEESLTAQGLAVKVIGSHEGFYYNQKDLHCLVKVRSKNATDNTWFDQNYDVGVPLSKYSGTATEITDIKPIGNKVQIAGVK
jgi:hypothetical protein